MKEVQLPMVGISLQWAVTCVCLNGRVGAAWPWITSDTRFASLLRNDLRGE